MILRKFLCHLKIQKEILKVVKANRKWIESQPLIFQEIKIRLNISKMIPNTAL